MPAAVIAGSAAYIASTALWLTNCATRSGAFVSVTTGCVTIRCDNTIPVCPRNGIVPTTAPNSRPVAPAGAASVMTSACACPSA